MGTFGGLSVYLCVIWAVWRADRAGRGIGGYLWPWCTMPRHVLARKFALAPVVGVVCSDSPRGAGLVRNNFLCEPHPSDKCCIVCIVCIVCNVCRTLSRSTLLRAMPSRSEFKDLGGTKKKKHLFYVGVL